MASPFPIPLNAVRAIEIVARRGALAPAAEELGVTPGAVSQHLRRAEERLGHELFERTPQGLRPTPALRQILPQLSAGFAQLADALAMLRQGDEHVLTLTVGSVFASRWLVWRLGKFSALHPEIEVRLVVTGQMIDLVHSDIDCSIRFGRGNWPGVRAVRIGGARYSPVAAPPLAALLATPADLARVPIIRDTASMLSWSDWSAAAGIAPPEIAGPRYDDPALAFDAAISEQGVLLAVDMMSADAVSDGRLRRPFALSLDSDMGYWFVIREGRREPRKTRLFRDWLRAEVPDSADGYVAQVKRRRLPDVRL
ncbi:LysR substrate-binding domain-containing protein [Devosia sp.]|uniref:LysR substrate-binding domain-containing protein n=1 Tax=Devosia sp. TaxID=1871048 RepID=UPI0035B26217